MKLLLVLMVLVAVAVAETNLYPRGCIWIMGRCGSECPEGTHGYSTGCGRKTPEATCETPEPVQEDAIICDYSACYCDPPTLRDTVSGKCVLREDCSKKE